MIAFHAPVERLARAGAGWDVQRRRRRSDASFAVDAVVNAAGLGAQAIARATEGYPPERVPPLVLAKGNYFGCLGRPAFSRLIYPAPVDGGPRHPCRPSILPGACASAPTWNGSTREAYEVDPRRAESFYASIRRYWPGLPDGALVPDYAGIRPKLTGPRRAGGRFHDRRARPSTASPGSSTSSASRARA